jgi:hypothetical protein
MRGMKIQNFLSVSGDGHAMPGFFQQPADSENRRLIVFGEKDPVRFLKQDAFINRCLDVKTWSYFAYSDAKIEGCPDPSFAFHGHVPPMRVTSCLQMVSPRPAPW